MTPGTRLQQLRKARGLSLRDVADRVGLHFTYLSKIENDREPASAATLGTLSRLYNADVNQLLALAGKIPHELQKRATADREFALLLRALPWLDDATMAAIYRLADVHRGELLATDEDREEGGAA